MSDQEKGPNTDAEDLDFKIRGTGCFMVLIGFFPLIMVLGGAGRFKSVVFSVLLVMHGLGLMLSPSPMMVGWRKESAQDDWLSQVPPSGESGCHCASRPSSW